MARREITQRRKQILRFVSDFRREQGYPPSIREIASHFGLSANSTVHSHLVNLEQAGYLARSNGRPRSMRLTHKGLSLLNMKVRHGSDEWPEAARLEVEQLKRRLAAHLGLLFRLPWDVLARHCPEAELLIGGAQE